MKRLSLRERLRIVGWEVIGLGGAVLLITAALMSAAHDAWSISSPRWIYIIIGVALILVGMETIALTRGVRGEYPAGGT